MSLTLITAPPVEPVTAAQVWDHLRVNLTGSPEAPVDETHIALLTTAARMHIDGKDGWLGRALVQQTYDLKLDCFPGYRNSEGGYEGPYFAGDAIRIPLPPLQSVTSITYVDTNGDTQTLSSALYTVDTNSEPGLIVPVYGESWPSTRGQINAVTVRFVCGYALGGAASPPTDYRINIPTPIKQALLLLISHWYENREPVVVGATVAELPMAVDALLEPYRIWSFE